jgi:hypothetical protein
MHREDDIMSLKQQGPEGTSNVTKKEGTSEPSVSNLASDKEISEEGVSTSFYTDGPELNDNIPLLGALLHRHGKVFDDELTTTDQPQCRICLDVGGIKIVTFENILDKIYEPLGSENASQMHGSTISKYDLIGLWILWDFYS